MPEIRPPGGGRKRAKLLVYAIPGAGKTTLAGSAPKTLIIRPPSDHTEPLMGMAGVEETVVSSWSDMYETLQTCQEQRGRWDWVWLDSISLFQHHGLDDVFADAIARAPHRAKHGVDKGEYGINMQRILRWIRDMCGLESFHFGITAHPLATSDAEGNDLYLPWVQGKMMSETICGMMNAVGYLEVKRIAGQDGKPVIRRRLYFEPTGAYFAKDQIGFGRYMDSPTIPKLTEKLGNPAPASRRRRVATK